MTTIDLSNMLTTSVIAMQIKLDKAGIKPKLTLPCGKRAPSVYWDIAEVTPIIRERQKAHHQRKLDKITAAEKLSQTANPIVPSDGLAALIAGCGRGFSEVNAKLDALGAQLTQLLDAITTPDAK